MATDHRCTLSARQTRHGNCDFNKRQKQKLSMYCHCLLVENTFMKTCPNRKSERTASVGLVVLAPWW